MGGWPLVAMFALTMAACACTGVRSGELAARPAAPTQPLAQERATPHERADPEPPLPSSQSSLSMAELRASAQSHLALSERVGLVLPAAWPADDFRLLMLVYHSEALPSGHVSYRVRGPVARLSIDVRSGQIASEPLAAGGPAWTEHDDAGGLRETERAAEQALLEVVSGRVSADRTRAALQAQYCSLFREPERARSAQTYAPDFVSFLDCS